MTTTGWPSLLAVPRQHPAMADREDAGHSAQQRDGERDTGRAVAAGALVALVAGKVILAVVFYDPARVWLHQDDYCRALMAHDWGLAPYLYPADLHWLPLPFYLYGLASRIHTADPQLVFVMVSQALAACTLVPVYGLARVFFSRRAALCTAALYTFTAWQMVMSYSALAEPLYYFLMCCGVWGFAQWWVRGRLGPLIVGLLCLMLAAVTRYEAWLFLMMVDALLIIHIWRRRSLSLAVATALVVVPWLVPGLWILANLREHSVPLAFYTANRQAFSSALYEMTFLHRALRYPAALATLSIPLTALLVAALARFKAWQIAQRAQVIVVLTLGNLAAMVALYISGSGPSFVERIVLLHLFLLTPLAGAALIELWNSQHTAIRILAAVFLVAFAFEECRRVRGTLTDGRYSDYARLADDYTAISRFLAKELPGTAGVAAVHCQDGGYYVRFSSGLPEQVLGVTAENINAILAQFRVNALCVHTAEVAPWTPEASVDRAFRAAHTGSALTESRLGNWRIVRAVPQ